MTYLMCESRLCIVKVGIYLLYKAQMCAYVSNDLKTEKAENVVILWSLYFCACMCQIVTKFDDV